MNQFALLKYGPTANLGDEIQSLAARAFLPRVDLMIDRDAPDVSGVTSPTRIIVNGFFSHCPMKWPVQHKKLEPLFISLHLAHPAMMETPLWDYLAAHAPIGCRDFHTIDLLARHGIEAYFSACLTLTLKRRSARRDGPICFVDPFGPQERYSFPQPGDPGFRSDLWERFPREMREGAVYRTHYVHSADAAYKFRRADELLEAYSEAKLVVTARLHAALPCLAFGTPVLFLYRTKQHRRLGGLLELVHRLSLAELEAGKFDLDWVAPPPNPADISGLQRLLSAKCAEYAAAPVKSS